MGGFQSSEPDDYETNSSKEKQPGYSPKYQHHTQHPYNQDPQQKQQQLYPQPQDRQQQHQLQQQQHRNIFSVSTSELLEYLDREFSTTVDIIRTMRKEKKFDDDGRSYICEVMIEKEHLLRRLNNNTDIITELQQELSIYKRDLEKERAARENMKQHLEEVKTEKAALNMRLSKIAGDRLVRDNPSITDLSDRNRPIKIGEMYSEIYDNEWTDAFEALNNAGYSDQDAIETLRLTLLNVFQFCSKKAESLLKKTEEAVNILFEEYKATEQKKDMSHLTMPKNLSEQWGKLIRRSSFTDDLGTIALQDKWKPNIKGYQGLNHDQTILKAYMSASWNAKCIYALKPFIKKCIFLGWMMVVQSPPMILAECKPGENFQKEAYKEYTQRGSIINYVVWPALLLNQGGPVVGKGVAQAKKLN
ncbi:uncharacterized protein LOC128545988 [Mercenaria mercenaria]|uniref:uncharacterized protein LOC128545988 n=1 Tax=Mercenaria mercenaria TaxID=6596 RepID=UPI00234F6B36|nr:uncharacterized protein LOC128545988 [Mercenaria mercenaria]